jgi:hypothetical protein
MKNISPPCAAKEGCPSGLAMGGVVNPLHNLPNSSLTTPDYFWRNNRSPPWQEGKYFIFNFLFHFIIHLFLISTLVPTGNIAKISWM